jgi:hypothetical protein
VKIREIRGRLLLPIRVHLRSSAVPSRFIFLCVLCVLGGSLLFRPTGLAAQTTRESRLAVAKSRWEERLAKAAGKPIVADAYPTEESLVFLSAYSHTRDPRYAKQAATQLEYAHSREKAGILLTFANETTRDYQARQIYNFYLAYRILADARYLRWADDAARAMIKTIPRAAHAAANDTPTLFFAGYYTADGKPARATGQVIDVNQNAEVALAYSLLYHDPASAFFQDALAKEIAYQELLASMSIQDMTTGAIPLTDTIPGADTAYGSYATFSWVWCQQLWHEDRFDPHLRAAGKWLAPKMNLATDSQRYYPQEGAGPIPDWEANYRIPLLWYCGVDAQKFIADLAARPHDPGAAAKPGTSSPAPVYWAFFDLMGIPRAYYLDGDPRALRGSAGASD